MIELARRYGSAIDAEDWETARALLDPDVEVVRPSGRRYRGADAWIGMLSRSSGFTNIESAIESRDYEQHDGVVRETTDIVHRWRESGDVAYMSREETTIGFRNGKIARLESTVQHKAPR